LLLSGVMAPLLQLDPASGTNLALRDVCMLLVATFGVAYWSIALNPQRFRPLIGLGILGKATVVLAIYGHWLAGNIGWQLPLVASGDALFPAPLLSLINRKTIPRRKGFSRDVLVVAAQAPPTKIYR